MRTIEETRELIKTWLKKIEDDDTRQRFAGGVSPALPRPMAACMKCGRLAVLQTASRCAECSEPEAA